MAYFTKGTYERKANYAATKNAENAEIAIENGMTEEQAEVIKRLCSIRHYIHSNYLSWYSSEGATADTISQYLSELDNIKVVLAGLGVGSFSGSLYDYIPNDNDFDSYLEDGEDRYDDEVIDRVMSEIQGEISEYFENVNTSIEKFLSKVDEKYHTNFCPTGYARGQF